MRLLNGSGNAYQTEKYFSPERELQERNSRLKNT
jgi:hypothetical protein